MKDFLIMKGNKAYMPVEFTMPTGAVIQLFVNKEEFEKGEITEAHTFEDLRNPDGTIYIVSNEKR